MAKAKKSAAKTARKGKSKTKVKRKAARRAATKPKPAEGITAKLGNAVNAVVETIKETTEMRRKMHADQPEE